MVIIKEELKKIEIDSERAEYFEYLNKVFNEITEFLQARDGYIDTEKREMFFERVSSPFVFWKEKKAPAQAPHTTVKEDEKTQYMKALESKYGLIKKDGKYSLKSQVDTAKFREIAGKMKEAGYKWSSPDKGFIEVKL